MTLLPEFGDTPVPDDDAAALQSAVESQLGSPPLKAEIYDLEQTILGEVTADVLAEVLSGRVGLEQLMADAFLVDLHRQLYGDIWTWGGTLRRREVTIGVAPEQVAVQLRSSLDSYLAAQSDDGAVHLFDWDVDKRIYVDLLRAFDQDRDPSPLADFIPVQPLES